MATKATIFSWSERMISHTELRHGPDSYGRQQSGILDNGGNLIQPCRVCEEGSRVVKHLVVRKAQ